MSSAAVLWWDGYTQKKISVIGNSAERNRQIGDTGNTHVDSIVITISAIGVNNGFLYYRSASTSSIGQSVPDLSLIGKKTIGNVG